MTNTTTTIDTASAAMEYQAAYNNFRIWLRIQLMADDAQEKPRKGFAGYPDVLEALEDARAWEAKARHTLVKALDDAGESRVQAITRIKNQTRQGLGDDASEYCKGIRETYRAVFGVYPRKPVMMANDRKRYIGSRYRG